MEKDSLGHLPRLVQIFEEKDQKAERQRRDSGTSFSEEYDRRHRRRVTEDASVARRSVRQKRGSSQRPAVSFSNLPNPSLLSVISGLTNQTTTSSGSNSTITQKSYDRAHHVMKPRPPKGRKKLQQQKRQATKPPTADPPPARSNVFQSMSGRSAPESFDHNRPSSSGATSTSSEVTDIDEGKSSNAGEPEVESPMTSPTAGRQPVDDHLSLRDKFGRNSGISISESMSDSSSQQSAHYAHHVVEEEDDESDEEEEEEEEEGEEHQVDEQNHEDDDEVEEEETGKDHHRNQQHVHRHRVRGGRQPRSYALERISPPRVPSTSSSNRGERRHQRLRDQERELRDHVLQSPRPQRDFKFLGASSPSPHPAMSVVDTHPHADASSYYSQPPHAPGWPPPAHPAPPMGYVSPPQVPPALYPENSYAMTTHSHMPATSPSVQPPPFQQHPPQSPQYQPYQPYPTGPDPPQKTVVGYELLAEKLTGSLKEDGEFSGEGAVVPMYRKFENLNHRVLLHLQDEISELEEELRIIDESIAQAVPGPSGHMQLASRRAESRYGNELHYKRTDLLGRIFLKLGQYSMYYLLLNQIPGATNYSRHGVVFVQQHETGYGPCQRRRCPRIPGVDGQVRPN